MNFNGVQHHWWERRQLYPGGFEENLMLLQLVTCSNTSCSQSWWLWLSGRSGCVWHKAHWYCQIYHPQRTIMTNICVSTWTQDSGLTFSFLDTFPFKLLSLSSIFTLEAQPGSGTASSAHGALCPSPSGKEAVFPNIVCKRRSSHLITPDVCLS